ncbi:MAG: signal peptide peptidase SppA [Bacteroidales bacterium]|nr:signal peptide peptidase SppA [Bacteroidales bacterium]
MKSFLKYTLATIVGIILSTIILFLFLIIIVAASSQEKPVEIKENTILLVKLNEQIVERTVDSPFNYFSSGLFTMTRAMGLNDILDNINKAKLDENISGIYMELTAIAAGMGTVEEIRNALIDYKESGKFLICYGDILTQKAYYLASVADTIYLNPAGQMILMGFGAQVMFYKEALDKLGVEIQIIRHGTYKSAVEPFMLNEMSDENREQTLAWVGTIWEHTLKGISEEREIAIEKLNEFADNMTIKNAQLALDNGLIDGIMFKDQVIDELKKITNTEEKKDLRSISLRKYTKVPKVREKGWSKDKIAVIYAHGTINLGNMGEGYISSERISKTIRNARRDSTIKAIVLRINSGGGGSLASEVIRREIELASEVKPVVASFGDVAASGGYYIAAQADTILCNPNTITGSIGVFAIIPYAGEFFSNKLGINMDVAKTNPHADMGSPFRPLSEDEKSVIRFGVEEVYDDFLEYVGDGRNMTREEVDAIGQGRVWSGVNALENGLVDLYGGKIESIEIAAKMAGLEKYRIVELPKLEDPFEQLLRELTENAKMRTISKELGEEFKYYKQLHDLKHLSGIQARLPFMFEIN